MIFALYSFCWIYLQILYVLFQQDIICFKKLAMSFFLKKRSGKKQISWPFLPPFYQICIFGVRFVIFQLFWNVSRFCKVSITPCWLHLNLPLERNPLILSQGGIETQLIDRQRRVKLAISQSKVNGTLDKKPRSF